MSYKNDFKSFRRKLINEGLFDNDPNKVFGLTRKHIELVLGIKLPLLTESINRHKQEEIVREQYLFEQWFQKLKQAATGVASQVGQFASGVGAAAKAATIDKITKPLTLAKDLKSTANAIMIMIQKPETIPMMTSVIGQKIEETYKPVADLFAKIKEIVQTVKTKVQAVLSEQEAAADQDVGIIDTMKNALMNLKAKYDELAGWKKVTFGLMAFVIFSYVQKQLMDQLKVSEILAKISKALPKGAVQKGLSVAASAKKSAEKAKGATSKVAGQAAFGGAEAGAKEAVTQLTTGLLKSLKEKFSNLLGTKLAMWVAGLAAGSFVTGIYALYKVVSTAVDAIKPIVNEFITKYNQMINPQQAAAPAAAGGAAPAAPQQAGAAPVMGEHRRTVKLSTILYGS